MPFYFLHGFLWHSCIMWHWAFDVERASKLRLSLRARAPASASFSIITDARTDVKTPTETLSDAFSALESALRAVSAHLLLPHQIRSDFSRSHTRAPRLNGRSSSGEDQRAQHDAFSRDQEVSEVTNQNFIYRYKLQKFKIHLPAS